MTLSGPNDRQGPIASRPHNVIPGTPARRADSLRVGGAPHHSHLLCHPHRAGGKNSEPGTRNHSPQHVVALNSRHTISGDLPRLDPGATITAPEIPVSLVFCALDTPLAADHYRVVRSGLNRSKVG